MSSKNARMMVLGLAGILMLAVFLPFNAWAQSPEGKATSVPPGMEVVAVTGGYQLIVPQGAKLTRVGAQVIVEGDKEYYSRRFFEMTQALNELKSDVSRLKEEQQSLRGEIDALKKELEKKQTPSSQPPDAS